jgi:hypothetical protein
MKQINLNDATVTPKDTMRILDIVRKAGFDSGFGAGEKGNRKRDEIYAKQMQFAGNMARSITDASKAIRRGRAAEEENYHAMADVFFARAIQLRRAAR